MSAEGLRTRYQYDGEGRVIAVIAGDLGPSPLPWDDACPAQASGTSVAGVVSSYEYDTSGRPVAMVDGRGLRTTWTYDGFGRPIIERRPDTSEVRTGYDVLGNVVWQAVYHAGVSMPYRAPTWGDTGLLAVTELRYDIRNRPLEEVRWHFTPQGPVGDGYARTTYLYDELYRTVTVTDDLGRATQIRTDGAGRPVQIRLPDNSLISTAFLDGGRTVRTTRNAVGGQVVEIETLAATGVTTETAIEVAGVRRVTSSTSWLDPFLPALSRSLSGAVTTPRYDAFDRVVGSTVTMPDGIGERVEVVRDRDGRVLARTSFATPDASGSKWTFEYDALGRVVRMLDPAGAATGTDYVGATDLIHSSIDPRMVRTTNAWAAGGWLAQSLVDAPTGDDTTLTFDHDSLGRMITASRRDGGTAAVTNTFAWDSLGNAVAEGDNTLGNVIARSHRYDGAGQRVASTFGVHSISRTFDQLGRQTSLRVGVEVPATATWSYTAPGGATQRQLRNGVATSYGYDALSRLVAVNDWNGTTSVASHEWELPIDGVPRRLRSQQRNFAPENRVFAIDTAGRLTGEQLGVNASFQLAATDLPAPSTALALDAMTLAATEYSLDGRNNWLTRWNGSATTEYARDARDALTAIGAQMVTSDATGAITGDGSTTYHYDGLGLLSEVRPAGGGGRLYKRDALGRIVTETDIASGAVTRFAWDGAQRIAVDRAGGELELTLAAEGLDQPVVTIYPNGSRRYFHQDRQGSVYAQTDDYGAGQLFISYTAYGEPSLRDGSGRALPASGVWPNFGYHGLPHDFGLGLVDMRARTYRPTLGRFLSPDPLGLLGDANLFAFVDSGPLTWRDPLGLAKLAKLRQIDADHDKLLEFEELFRFAQCSTYFSEHDVLFELVSRKALGTSRVDVSDAGWRWIQFSVGHGLSSDFEARAQRFAESTAHIAERKPLLTTGPLGTMLSSDYRALEEQISFSTNMSALRGGASGAVLQSVGMPELGIIANSLSFVGGAASHARLAAPKGPAPPPSTQKALPTGVTVAPTSGWIPIMPIFRGFTANGRDRWLPGTLREQLAVQQVMQNPRAGKIAAGAMGDPRWPASEGWVKMQQTIDPGGTAGKISVHYNLNTLTGWVDDFKIVERRIDQ